MDKLLHIPNENIPPINTQAFALLISLLSKDISTTLELTNAIGANPRSALQALGNRTYGHWLIHNYGDTKGRYQLDSRHITGCLNDDMDARIERKKLLAESSKNQSEKEALRYPAALLAKSEADKEYQERFKFDEEKPAEEKPEED